jgi:hypothetical protein
MTLLMQEHGMFRIEGRSGFSRVPRIPAGEVEAFDQLFNIVTVHLFRRIFAVFQSRRPGGLVDMKIKRPAIEAQSGRRIFTPPAFSVLNTGTGCLQKNL